MAIVLVVPNRNESSLEAYLAILNLPAGATVNEREHFRQHARTHVGDVQSLQDIGERCTTAIDARNAKLNP